MKKILYSLIAVLAMVMSSCSNDDIEIIKTGGVTFNISTQGVYDDFEISEQFKSRFLSGSYNIGVYTFVYDEEGNLAASDSVYTQTFGTISQSFSDLRCGNYTAITLEMLVDADENYQSDNWVIVGKDKISTLEIVNKDFTSYWYSAVGTSTNNINVTNDNGTSLNIVPKGIGAIVETRMTNFDKSDYKCLNFFTKDQPVGRFLNPALTGEDRFHYESYNETNTWTERGYTWSSAGLKDVESPTIYLLEEGNVRCCFGAQKEDANGKLIGSFIAYPNANTILPVSDGKTYYGGFHYIGGSDDKCTASMFDSWDNYLTWYKSLTTVNTLVPDLYMNWGGSVNNAQSFMNGYSMTLGKTGQAILMSDGSYEIDYKGKGKESLISYSFKKQSTGLFEVDVRYSKSTVTKNEIMNYLTANYTYITNQDDIYMYMSTDRKTIVMFFSVADEWDLGFVDADYLNSASNAKLKNNPKELLKVYMKR